MSILLLVVQERLGEMVDCRASVALEDSVNQLTADSGVVRADTFEIGHSVRAKLFYDLIVVHALRRGAHRIADETSHKTPVNLVG